MVSGVVDSVEGVAAVARGSASAAGVAAKTAGAMGAFLPILIIGGLIFLAVKLLSVGSAVAAGVGDAYTGGAVTRVSDSVKPRRRSSSRPAAVRSGAPRRSSTNRPARQIGQQAGAHVRRQRNVAKGPQPTFHDGRRPQVCFRRDDKAGAPVEVTVCAGDPGSAAMMLGARMNGHTWRAGGVKACDLNKAHHHFTFRRA